MSKTNPNKASPWRTSYEAGVPESVAYETICLPDILARTARKFPGNPALCYQGYRMTYNALHEAVCRFAAFLLDLGIGKGDRVAILLPNTIACVVSYYSVLKIGAVVVMNNPLYTDKELAHQFNDSGATSLITLDLLAGRMIALRTETRIKHIVCTSLGDYLPFPKNVLFPLVAKWKKLSAKIPPARDLYHWESLMTESFTDPAPVSITYQDTAMLQYTGGTTGTTKAAVLTHGNMSKQVQQIAAWFPRLRGGEEIMLGALPFFHVFGLSTAMNFSVFMGWCNILVPKPTPEALLEAIEKYNITFAPMVPTMYIGILNHPKINRVDLSSIKGCFSGSAPLAHEVIRSFEDKTGAVIVEGYGLTETSPVTHVNPFAAGKRKVGSIGIPLSDTQCRLIDASNGATDLPAGRPGELLIRGPQVMKAYWNRPGETRTALKDHWFHTGDIARMDEDGYFYIVDRKKDMIISGGFNVYPREIEELLFRHPKIMESAVIGVPHAKRGEAVIAYVVLKKGCTATQEELMAHCREGLARYKWPEKIVFRDSLPKSHIGKILKRKLRGEGD